MNTFFSYLSLILAVYGTLFALRMSESQILASPMPASEASAVSPFFDLQQKAIQIPTFRDLYEQGKVIATHNEPCVLANREDYQKLRLITFEQFETVLDEFIAMATKQLSGQEAWLHERTPLASLVDPESATFLPYAQKIFEEPGTFFACKGDLHGDIHSLIAYVIDLQMKGVVDLEDPLKIFHPRLYMVFHGDYVDRGIWGVEVLYLLMLLKINNPDKVVLVRGNHEDPRIARMFGFFDEFHSKFADVSADRLECCYHKISKFYDFLPIVLYAGSGRDIHHYMQCNHGGMEHGYNPKELLNAPKEKKYQWIEKFYRATECAKLIRKYLVEIARSWWQYPLEVLSKDFVALSPTEPYRNGFLWNDFSVDPKAPLNFQDRRGLTCNKAFTEDVLAAASTDKAKLSFVVRAHQHMPNNNDPLMNLLLASQGCAVLWREKNSREIELRPGLVLTLLLSPDSLYGTPYAGGYNFTGFDYDTWALIVTGEDLYQWNIRIFNNEIYAQRASPAV